ncbi:hypothetical protein MTR67_050596, partial [Solanum verrucosum]
FRSQNSDAPKKKNEKTLQTSVDLDFLQSSLKPSNDYPYVLSLPNPFGFNQHDIDSSSRSISNPAPELTLTVGHNLPSKGDIANPFGFNQHDIDSSSRSISNFAPELTLTVGQNLPSKGDIANPFGFNQHDIDSSSRSISNPTPELTLTVGQNLPSEGDIANPFGFNQHDIDSSSRSISNSAPELTLTVGQNLPSKGDIANSNNWVVIPSRGSLRTCSPRANYPRGRMSGLMHELSARREVVEGENMQYPNIPPWRTIQVTSNLMLNQQAMFSASSIQAPLNPFVVNQRAMFSTSRPVFNPAPQLSFTMSHNLPPTVYNINTNRPAIPSIRNPRGRGSR